MHGLEKNVWVDVHVFDGSSDRIHAETFTLQYLAPADGGGDLFGFNDVVYRGSGAVPGSVWTQPDARKLQFRLYYEVNHQVFTDAFLHEFELQPDDEVRNPAH